MPMIPLSVVLAAILGYYLLLELTRVETRNVFACAFLIFLMIQLSMAGIRFGYGIEQVKIIYPFTASMIGPLAYLSFKNPSSIESKGIWHLFPHLIPLLVITLLAIFAIHLIDPALGIITMAYGIALVVLAVKEKDTFPWVDFNHRDYVRRALWGVIALAFVSATTDFIITYDNLTSRGSNIPEIVGGTTMLVVVFFIFYIIWQKVYEGRQSEAGNEGDVNHDDPAEEILIQKLESLIDTTRLHLDSDLNLNRIARKLGIPARQVSMAINRQKLVSVSQYINNLRIEEACRLLRESTMTVTSVMLQSGFTTKSNFNREFSRQMGMSPSAWRQQI